MKSAMQFRKLLVVGGLAVLAVGCVGPREGAAPEGSGSARVKNGSNVLDSDSFDDFTGALALTTSLLKSDAPAWDLAKEIEDNKCTPSDRNGKLINASLAGCVFSDPTTAWIDYSKMKDKSDRTNAVKTDLWNWYYQIAKWPRNFTKHDLRGATFRNIDLSYFQKMADPQYATKTVGENARFAGAIFAGSTFENVRVSGSFVGADFRGFRVKSLGDLATARLDGANLSGADLAYMKLPYSLLGIDFSKADMRGVTVVDALLTSVNFDDANLSGASLVNASIGGQFGLSSEILDLFPGRTASVTSMRRTDLSFANLANANLSRIDFTGANLTGANLSNANLLGAKFIGANLTGANLSGAKFGCGGACDLVNREMTSFDKATLDRANFAGSFGNDITFSNVSAEYANFSNTSFTRADFSNSDVSGASFVKSRIDGAKFANTFGKCTDDGYCTDFTEANLLASSSNRSEIAQYTGGTYLDRMPDFSGANFTRANLSGVEFDAIVKNAVFICTSMVGSRVSYWTEYDGATFAGVNFTNAIFQSRQAPPSASVDCNAKITLPATYPIPTPTTALAAPNTTTPATTIPVFAPPTSVAPTTVPPTTIPPTTVAPTTTLPLQVPIGKGGCPAGYRPGFVKNTLKLVCFRV